MFCSAQEEVTSAIKRQGPQNGRTSGVAIDPNDSSHSSHVAISWQTSEGEKPYSTAVSETRHTTLSWRCWQSTSGEQVSVLSSMGECNSLWYGYHCSDAR
jgi:hypothetical protein